MPRIIWSEPSVREECYHLDKPRESYPRAVMDGPVGWRWYGSGFACADIAGYLTIDKLACGKCGSADTLFVFVQYDGGVGGSSAVQEVWCPHCCVYTTASGMD